MFMKVAVSSRENSGIHIRLDKNLFDLENTGDTVLLSGDPSKLQFCLDCLK